MHYTARHVKSSFFVRNCVNSTIYLCDVGEADDEGDETDNEDEDLLPLPQHHGIFIHQGGDEAFHCAELTQGSIKRRESEL